MIAFVLAGHEMGPGLILLDLMMPEMDGFEFMAAMRRRAEGKTIPVIVITVKDLTSEDLRRLNGGLERMAPSARLRCWSWCGQRC